MTSIDPQNSSVDPTYVDIEVDAFTQTLSGYTRHKNMYFEVPYVSRISGNLFQGGCSMGLDLPKEIVHVISLYPWESYRPSPSVRSMLVVTMLDDPSQDLSKVDDIARWVNACASDAPTLVHCQAGLNRSGLVAARALMFQGMSSHDAIALLRATRSRAVLCNPAFEQWLHDNPVQTLHK